MLWGGWLLVTGGVFSFMAGIIHPYYTVALVPAIGALTGIGAVELWRRREHAAARLVLGAGIAVTATWAYLLLGRTPAWLPWLRTVILVCGLAGAAALLAMPAMTRLAATGRGRMALAAATGRGRMALAAAPAAAGLVAVLAGPAAYSIDTAATAHTGALPTAGPAVTGAFGGGFPGGGAAPGRGAVPGGARAPGGTGRATGGFPGGTSGPGGAPARGAGGQAGGSSARAAGDARGAAGIPGGTGGPGGLSGNTQVAAALTRLIRDGAAGHRWAAATAGLGERGAAATGHRRTGHGDRRLQRHR